MPKRWDPRYRHFALEDSNGAAAANSNVAEYRNRNVVQVCCCDIATIGIIGEIVQPPSCVRHGGVKVTWSIRVKVSAEHGQASVSPFNLRRAKSSNIISSSPSASLRVDQKIIRKIYEVFFLISTQIFTEIETSVTVRKTSNRIISVSWIANSFNSLSQSSSSLRYYFELLTCPVGWGSCQAGLPRCRFYAWDLVEQWTALVPPLPVWDASEWRAVPRLIRCRSQYNIWH